jgi:hypothetical protein
MIMLLNSVRNFQYSALGEGMREAVKFNKKLAKIEEQADRMEQYFQGIL